MKVLFTDNVFGYSGYSTAVRELAYPMSKMGYVKILGNLQNDYLPEKILPLLVPGVTTQYDFVVTRPYFNPMPQGIPLIGNVVLECTQFPERMVMECNSDQFKRIWVPSNFVKENAINSGVVANKIDVIPHGVSSAYKPLNISKDGLFRFLFVGGYRGYGDRKGADIASKAFLNTFKGNKKVELVMKINTAYGFSEEHYNQLKGDNIKIITDNLTEDAMVHLYNSADCYVCPSYGEGFNMTCLEAMACGLPVMSTMTGEKDFLKFNFPIDTCPIRAKGEQWDQGYWQEPNQSSLEMLMELIVKGQDNFKNVGKLNVKEVKKWTWEVSAIKAWKSLSKLSQE